MNKTNAKKISAAKYDEKLTINGIFEEPIKVSAHYTPPVEKAPKKAAKKKG